MIINQNIVLKYTKRNTLAYFHLIPLGMAIGIAIGAGMDKKALEEGRQLDIEIRSLSDQENWS